MTICRGGAEVDTPVRGIHRRRCSSKILIANRGEIACRIIKTAQRMGIFHRRGLFPRPTATRSMSKWRSKAVLIGPPPAAQSYLLIDSVVEACKATGAEAVHPGYGFLSEREAFPVALAKAGIAFIGPNPPAIAAMGDKIKESKKAAAAAKVFDRARLSRRHRGREASRQDR